MIKQIRLGAAVGALVLGATLALAPADASAAIAHVDHLVVDAGGSVPAGLGPGARAEAFDAQGDDLGDVSNEATFSIQAVVGGDTSSARCGPNYCSALTPGTYLVAAGYANPDGSVASGTATLTVTPALVIVVQNNLGYQNTLYRGTFVTAKVVGDFSDGTVRDITKDTVFTSHNSAVASVRGNRITAVAPGRTRIDFAYDGTQATGSSYLKVLSRTVAARSVDPAGGGINDVLTVRGTNLDTVTSVYFGATPASFLCRSSSQLSVVVSVQSYTGPIRLRTAHGTLLTPGVTIGG